MKSTVLWLLVVLAVLVGAGILVFRSTAPSPEAVEEPQDLTFEDETEVTEGVNGGQFIQEEPEKQAPAGTAETPVAPATGPSGDAVVSMTDTGFVPNTVTIGVGDTVTFVNDGQALHWPASDVHPTHEVLPEFDADRGLATGETYSYTFAKAGTWKFHDHLQAQFTGTVVVK